MNDEPSPYPPAGPDAVAIRTHGQAIAMIPALLGFVPEQSVVLLGTHHDRVVAVARADLANAERIAHGLTPRGPLNPADTIHTTIIAASEHTPSIDWTDHDLSQVPYLRLAKTLTAGLTAAGFQIAHTTWTPALQAGRPWYCYRETGCHGALPDPRTTVLATTMTVAGQITYPSRHAMAYTLHPDPPHLLQPRAQQITTLISHTTAEPRASVELIRVALSQANRGHYPATDEQISALAAALSDPVVRDGCIAFCLDERIAPTAQQLWTTLVRRTPTPYRAEPAVLLAITTYLHGNTVLAGLAIDAALDAEPGHQLAGTLRLAIRMGLPTDDLRAAMNQALHPHQ
jgi:Domain of unknown function (DUF4192)